MLIVERVCTLIVTVPGTAQRYMYVKIKRAIFLFYRDRLGKITEVVAELCVRAILKIEEQ